jgi:hypothetical protein
MKYINSKTILTGFIAFIFVQSFFFKFSGANETRYIFETLGTWSGFDWFSHYGAYLIGGAELMAVLLLLTRLSGLGALLTVGIMSGAILFHLFTPLGIEMPEFDAAGTVIGDDGGLLFIMACLVWVSGSVLCIKDIRSENGILSRIANR